MPAGNVRFGAMSAVPRRQFCGKLNVITPQAVQWKPPPHKAAGTLGAIWATDSVSTNKQDIFKKKIWK
jgi:hypothetical protein